MIFPGKHKSKRFVVNDMESIFSLLHRLICRSFWQVCLPAARTGSRSAVEWGNLRGVAGSHRRIAPVRHSCGLTLGDRYAGQTFIGLVKFIFPSFKDFDEIDAQIAI